MSGKFHIAKDGSPKQCKASLKPCPYGGLEMHYNDLNEAMDVADKLNEQLANMPVIGFAKVDNHVVASRQTENAIIQLENIKMNISRLESIKNNARENIRTELNNNQIKTLKTDFGDFTSVAGSSRTTLDNNKAKEYINSLSENEQSNYYKDVNVSEFVSRENENTGRKLENFKKEMKTIDGKSMNFEIKDGKPTEETLKAIADLRDFENKLTELKALEKAVKSEIMDSMKEKDISEFKVGKHKITYSPQGVRKNINTAKFKEMDNYSDFTVTKETVGSLRVKFTDRPYIEKQSDEIVTEVEKPRIPSRKQKKETVSV